MINIRISNEEYQEIKSGCGGRYAANVSEFVRAATMHALSAPGLSATAISRLQFSALERRMDRLDEQMAALAARVDIVF